MFCAADLCVMQSFHARLVCACAAKGMARATARAKIRIRFIGDLPDRQGMPSVKGPAVVALHQAFHWELTEPAAQRETTIRRRCAGNYRWDLRPDGLSEMLFVPNRNHRGSSERAVPGGALPVVLPRCRVDERRQRNQQ